VIETRGIEELLCAKDSFREDGSEMLDWFEKVTKSGLGIQGT
jgi:hypothetical protein